MIFQSLNDIVQAKVPLVLPDTCILLDILRSPHHRKNVDARSVISAKAIADAVSGGSVASIIAKQVRDEFNENCASVQQTTEGELSKLQSEFNRINEWSQALGANGYADISHTTNAVSQCNLILDNWISSSLSFPINKTQLDKIIGKSHKRVVNNITPARKGKDSYKDCHIVETYLEVARILRSKGYSGQIVFASSNTKDFTGSPSRKLQDDISQEFNLSSIIYARSLHETRYKLGLCH